jgi:hypothetical protein
MRMTYSAFNCASSTPMAQPDTDGRPRPPQDHLARYRLPDTVLQSLPRGHAGVSPVRAVNSSRTTGSRFVRIIASTTSMAQISGAATM